jgi:hypothetical protein
VFEKQIIVHSIGNNFRYLQNKEILAQTRIYNKDQKSKLQHNNQKDETSFTSGDSNSMYPKCLDFPVC